MVTIQNKKCPICHNKCFANFVLNGSSLQQVELYHCPVCAWVELCPHKDTCPGEKCASYAQCKKSKTCLMKVQDRLAKTLFGITQAKAQEEQICINCKCPITYFKDELSRKEYRISSLCQQCQDKIFKV